MTDKKYGIFRFALAGLLCVIAAYFTDKTLGAVASLYIIIILCTAAYLIYKKALSIIALCTLGGIVFKLSYGSGIKEILQSVFVCILFSALPILAIHIGFGTKQRCKKRYIWCFAIFVLSIFIHSFIYGTFFGNITSKKLNESYLKSEYPDTEFTFGSTYYSIKDRAYLTSAIFRDKEVYSALFSVSKKDGVIIDGYRDYCEARLLEYGTDRLSSYLESYVHEGEDFALRRNKISVAERLTDKSLADNYYPYMVYDIAFYDVFSEKSRFEEKCALYASYIPDSFEFDFIRFYGIGENGKFKFQRDLTGNRSFSETSEFDKLSFDKYYSDKDTHRYWSVIK